MELRATGLKETISRLRAIRNRIPDRTKLLMERLAEAGYPVAELGFRTAEYDGTNDVTVQEAYWQDEHTLVLAAHGQAVAFIEFGTGVFNPPHPNPPSWAQRGEYGKGHGKRKAWGYYGDPGTNGKVRASGVVITHGNPPARAMYDATQEMRRQVRQIALEVWKES